MQGGSLHKRMPWLRIVGGFPNLYPEMLTSEAILNLSDSAHRTGWPKHELVWSCIQQCDSV